MSELTQEQKDAGMVGLYDLGFSAGRRAGYRRGQSDMRGRIINLAEECWDQYGEWASSATIKDTPIEELPDEV